MLEIILTTGFSTGSYLAIWKVIIFLGLFGLYAWVGQWLDKDVLIARASRTLWNCMYLGAGTLVLLLWFMLPTPFIVVLLFFVVIWLTVMVTYVMHRNARVGVDEQICTMDHLRSLASRERKTKVSHQRVTFVTANRNELPIPHRQDAEYEGYVLAEDLTYETVRRRASRTDLLPTGEGAQHLYTIDGVVGVAGEKTRLEVEQILTYLKAVAGMDVKERRRPQSGNFRVKTPQKNLEFKLTTAGSTRGEQMLLERVEQFAELKMESLGLNSDQLEALQKTIEETSGITLITGLAGMGVTTTLYSVVRRHDAFTQNINSLEQNPLLELDNITQNIVEANADPKTTAKQLQTVLRKDPDVVLVGFCDSAEMAKIATQAALEGKKLYLGMTAAGTFEAMEQWLKMVEKSAKVADSLKAITSQRLLRKLCTACREAYVPDAGMLRKLNLPADKIKNFYRPPTQLEYDKRGNQIVCEVCQGTGYVGRTAVFETLFVTDSVRQMIQEDVPLTTLRNQCRKERMLYLQEQAIRKVMDGTTSIQEVLRVTADRNAAPRKPPATGASPVAAPNA